MDLKRKASLVTNVTDSLPPHKRRKQGETEIQEEISQDSGIFDTRPPPSVDCIAFTSSDNERVYVAVESHHSGNQIAESSMADVSSAAALGCSLLATPIAQLLSLVEQRKFDKLAASAMQQPESQTSDNKISRQQESALLVDKYAPRDFADLLTNDRFNREVLRWIMQFDNALTAQPPPEQKSWKSKYDNDQSRILLLAGPPGIGKTTLAHIAAKHANYSVYEINASDDRTPKDLLNILSNLSTPDVLLFSKQQQQQQRNKQPYKGKLLILDEIDGIEGREAKSFIDMLLKFADVNRKRNKKEKTSAKANSNSNPIICICNDPYAPQLRELRQNSKLFIFRRDQINHDRIAERLKFVCQKESLDIPPRILKELVVKFDGDIRSCLNTLQYLKKYQFASDDPLSSIEPSAGSLEPEGLEKSMRQYEQKQIRQKQLVNAIVSTKDTRRDFFDICTKIFYNPSNHAASLKGSNAAVSMETMYSWINAEVSADKLLDGCFETYPNMRYLDRHMRKTIDALEYLCFSELLQHHQRKTQNYSLITYSVLPYMAFHLNCGQSTQIPRVEFPRVEFEVYQRKKQNENISKTLITGVTPELRRCISLKDTQIDLIPFLPMLVTPTIKQSNPQLFNAFEKREMANVIDTHVQYGITYQQVFSEGKICVIMDPYVSPYLKQNFFNPISDVTALTQCEPSPKQRKGWPFVATTDVMKKYIASEIVTEKIKRAVKKQKKHKEEKPDNGNESPFKLPRAQPSSAVALSPIKLSPHKKNAPNPFNNLSQSIVHFKYSEGMTNAVRRLAKIKEFL